VTNPWLQRRVLAYAHQGGALEAPSSTMHAFRRAVALGCPALEMDVHQTADGHLVVSHDETVDRTSNAIGRICTFTLAQLLALDNAHWFVAGRDVETGLAPNAYRLRGRYPQHDPSLGFARLEEVLDEFPRTFLNFDIKETTPTVAPYEQKLADTLRAYDRIDDVIVASFHDDALRSFRAYAPEIHTSLGPEDTLAVGVAVEDGPLPQLGASMVALQVPEYFGSHRIVTRAFVDGAHELGLAVHVWTVDEPDHMARLLDAGVDGLISDVPSVLLRVLHDRSASFQRPESLL
jgi:glycerophosphoryl diester phosphodiesterase